MGKFNRNLFAVFFGFFILLHVWLVVIYPDGVVGSFWSLLPALVVISMCLITKEVFSSLFYGCFSGAILMVSDSDLVDIPFNVLTCLVGGNGNKVGLIDVLSDSWNVGILIFLAALGILTDLLGKSGARAAFTKWTLRHVNSRRSGLLVTLVMGCLIFIDDYFNCLTVGTVMRPVTDANRISRAKLAYLVDSTASPVCMLVPLSSWVAAVSGYVSTEQVNGIDLFICQIPYNFYSILTLVMIVLISILNIDFGPMLIHERNAQLNNDVFTTELRSYEESESNEKERADGSYLDFIVPILVLIVTCLGGILATGGFFHGNSFINAFAEADASRGLVFGSLMTCVFMHFYCRVRRNVNFVESMLSIPNGVKHMAMPISILILAWLFGSIARNGLGIDVFFSGFVGSFEEYVKFIPAFIFLLSCILAFATGTSWGTIAVMAPIVVSLLNYSENPTTCVIGLSAICAGSVCGDHASPISDTTIMASTGSHCSLMDHVVTQLPYVMLVVAVSFAGFLLTSFVDNPVICLFMTAVLLFAALLIIKSVVFIKNFGLFEELSDANDKAERKK